MTKMLVYEERITVPYFIVFLYPAFYDKVDGDR